MKKNRILYVTSKGGIHDYRFLSKLVNDYEILLLHYAADTLIDEIAGLPDLEIISVKPVFKSFPLLSELFHFNRVVKTFKPHIFHSGYVWQVGLLPAILDLHPHLSMVWGSDVLIEPQKNFVIKKIVRKVMNQADHIQCDAQFVKTKIMNDYDVQPDKITVFPWGIDLNKFKPKERSGCRSELGISLDKFVVVFNRNLEDVYGIIYLLDAFNEFAKDKNDVYLLMISDGSLKDNALEFITRNKLESKIRLVGRVPNEKIPSILNCSDVYVSTSLSDGTSLSLLEAIACGLGVIVTDVPSIKEWVSDENGIVVGRKNAHQVKDALNKYYSDRVLIKNHGSKNIQIARERADWDRNYEKLKEIYTKLISG